MIPKFRAWVKPEILSNHMNGVIAEAKPDFIERVCLVKRDDLIENECFDEIFDFDDVILMQSTGLKDKNGVEIYVGDIAETRQSDLSSTSYEMVGGVVTYDSDYGMFKLVRKYGSKFHPFTIWLTNVEIIGNIYANPELLSQGIE